MKLMVQMDRISVKSDAWSKKCPTIFLLEILCETSRKVSIFNFLNIQQEFLMGAILTFFRIVKFFYEHLSTYRTVMLLTLSYHWNQYFNFSYEVEKNANLMQH